MQRLLILCFAALAVACGGRQTRPADTATPQPAPRVFLPALAPSALSAEEKQAYLGTHYWDKFDFSDTLFVHLADSALMLQAYAHYAALLLEDPTGSARMDTLMQRASASRPMLDYFAWLAQEVLNDPNSPLRSDELYIPVLRAQLASPYYDQYERIAPEYALKIVTQNRIGEAANDFRYTLASEAQGTLYALKAEYVLLFIHNPDCPMCKQIKEEIIASPMLTEMIERGRLQLLAIYTDEDLAAWRAYADQMPAAWINAYDKNFTIRDQNLYNLKAIPALYLLDNRKRVLVKDSVSVPQIEEVIDRRG